MCYKILAIGIACLGWSVAANAQGLPTSCVSGYTDPPATCSFSCVAGRQISIYGYTEMPSGTASIQVIASCDGVEIVQCSGMGHAATGCSATSSTPPVRDGLGTCYVTGSYAQTSEFSCTTL
jgi:hypothetical protein